MPKPAIGMFIRGICLLVSMITCLRCCQSQIFFFSCHTNQHQSDYENIYTWCTEMVLGPVVPRHWFQLHETSFRVILQTMQSFLEPETQVLYLFSVLRKLAFLYYYMWFEKMNYSNNILHCYILATRTKDWKFYSATEFSICNMPPCMQQEYRKYISVL